MLIMPGSLCVSEEADKAAPSAGAANAEETVPLQAAASSSAISGGEQTTLVHNEDEAFALEPLDITAVPGIGRCHSLPALKHQTNVYEVLNGVFFPIFFFFFCSFHFRKVSVYVDPTPFPQVMSWGHVSWSPGFIGLLFMQILSG